MPAAFHFIPEILISAGVCLFDELYANSPLWFKEIASVKVAVVVEYGVAKANSNTLSLPETLVTVLLTVFTSDENKNPNKSSFYFWLSIKLL